MFYCGFGLLYCLLPTGMVWLSICIIMNGLQNSTLGFIYSMVEILLYGITTISGVVCQNPPSKAGSFNLQQVIGCAMGVVGMIVGFLQLCNVTGTFSHVIQFILTLLSIVYLLKLFCDVLDRRQLGRIVENSLLMA